MGVCHVSWPAVHSLLLDEDLDYAFLEFQVGLMDHEHTAEKTGEEPAEADEPGLDPPDVYWGATNLPPNILVHLDGDVKKEWIEAYQNDPHLVKIWKDQKSLVENWMPGHRFFRDPNGLLFFRDTDYQLQLWVPLEKRRLLLEEGCEQAYKGAHQGLEKL